MLSRKYSVLLTAVGVITVILNALTGHYISEKRVNVTRTLNADSGKLYAATMGGIEMIETIKATGAENGFFTKWSGYQALVSNGNVKMMRINLYLGMIPEALTRIADIIVLVLGILLIIRGKFTPGYLLSFTGLLSAFMDPVTRLIGLGQTVQEIQTDMARIEDVMLYPEDTKTAPESVPDNIPKRLSGKLDLEHVSFGYSPLEPPLIEDLSFHLEPGKWVALVGASGSGKSTVAKLITGLYPVRSGEIRFDGIPIQDIPSIVLRGSVTMVDQNMATFYDTVADNITLWDKSIEDFELILACRDAEIHEEIAARPGSYLEMVQPGGGNFSGGQLQRMEIAHALASDPVILVMDEATSALDAQTEARVIQRIRDRGIGCVVVAHRLSTIRDCDEIIVLDNGKVKERGTHEELMTLDGLYAELIRSS
ncbi:MAG: ATP-binding cassette domain-containing protein [Anaerolineaceae bacterium]|nr:ATP-binding cassette domain-containing protein [Anaerolineaceae bacterium]